MSLATSPFYLNLKIPGQFNWKVLLEYLTDISIGNVENPKAYAKLIDVGDKYYSVYSPTEKMHYLIYKEGKSWNNFVVELKRKTPVFSIGKSTKTRKSVRKTKKSVRKTRKSPRKTKKSVRKSPRKIKKSARKTRK